MGNITDPMQLRAGTLVKTALHVSEILPSMDFETYSEAGYIFVPNEEHGSLVVNGRKKWIPPYSVKGVAGSKKGLSAVGIPVYAEHPSTEILSLYYDLKDGAGLRCWLPGTSDPADLLNHIARGGLIEGHNATFEWYIWNLVAVKKLGWPPLPLPQLRCSMAKSKRYSLPGGLDAIAAVLGTAPKDSDGKRLLEKLSQPHSPTKHRAEHRWTVTTAWEDFKRLYEYNAQDVVAESQISARIPDLTPYEFSIWQIDQVINARGIAVDQNALDSAINIHVLAAEKYNNELKELTQGEVENVNQNKRFISWVVSQGIKTRSLDEAHRAKLLKGTFLPANVRRALEIADLIMSANIKKLYTLKRQLSCDGRLRDQYRYCGADRTGRWAAGGVQLQNITAKGPKPAQCDDENCGRYFGAATDNVRCPHCGSWLWHEVPEWNVHAARSALQDIRQERLDLIEEVWGAPVDVLCGCLRALFISKPGTRFLCCDFSAIEAVAAACLSRCQWRIDVFNAPGECIYTQSASKITGNSLDFYKSYYYEHGAHHPDRKTRGKIAELASGYGGWINAWKNFGADKHFTDEEIKENILKWRQESPEIVEMWGGEYKWGGPGKWDYYYQLHGLEGAAMQAIMSPGNCYAHNDITYGVSDDILFCRLPSGRYLYYHKPRLTQIEDKLKRGPAHQITFEGWNSNPLKGPIGWHRWETYGGRLFENVVQAVSADIQAEAILRCEAAGYPVVLHTHDEICAEVPHGYGSLEEMAAIMSQRPTWANWWPLRAAGWEDTNYQKD